MFVLIFLVSVRTTYGQPLPATLSYSNIYTTNPWWLTTDQTTTPPHDNGTAKIRPLNCLFFDCIQVQPI